MSKYNPDNVRWVDFILAMYYNNEQQLWENIFKKYQMPTEPKEPTWGKGIRKERWSRYENEKAEYEQKAIIARNDFKKECEYWDGKFAAYLQQHQGESGRNLLQRALSGNGNVIAIVTTTQAPAASATTQTFQAKVPEGLRPGDQFQVSANGAMVNVKVPQGAAPGTYIQFSVPAATQKVEETIPTARYVSEPRTTTTTTTTTAPEPSKPAATSTYSAPAPSAAAVPPSYASYKPPSFRAANVSDGGWAPAESDLYASAAPSATTTTNPYDAPPPAIGAPTSSSLSAPPPAIGAPTQQYKW